MLPESESSQKERFDYDSVPEQHFEKLTANGNRSLKATESFQLVSFWIQKGTERNRIETKRSV